MLWKYIQNNPSIKFLKYCATSLDETQLQKVLDARQQCTDGSLVSLAPTDIGYDVESLKSNENIEEFTQ